MNLIILSILIISFIALVAWISILYCDIRTLKDQYWRNNCAFIDLKNEVSEVIRSKAKFLLDAPGSGRCNYELTKKKTIRYNEFASEFSGFYINEQQVSLKEILKELDKL